MPLISPCREQQLRDLAFKTVKICSTKSIDPVRILEHLWIICRDIAPICKKNVYFLINISPLSQQFYSRTATQFWFFVALFACGQFGVLQQKQFFVIFIASRHHSKNKPQTSLYMVHKEECVTLQRDSWERQSLEVSVVQANLKERIYFLPRL